MFATMPLTAAPVISGVSEAGAAAILEFWTGNYSVELLLEFGVGTDNCSVGVWMQFNWAINW